RSIDNGDTWVEMNSGLTAQFIVTLAINLQGDLFAGTDFGEGIFRSTDDGASWIPLTIATSNNVYGIVVDSGGDLFAGTYGDGIFRSSDNGTTWTMITPGPSAQFILALAVNDSGDLFAGTYFGN